MLTQIVLVQQLLLHGFLAGGDCLGVDAMKASFLRTTAL